MRSLAFVAVLLAATVAAAQDGLIPASPTTGDFIILRLTISPPPGAPPAVSRTGNRIRIDLADPVELIPLPPVTYNIPIGYLPAGNYTWALYDREGQLSPDVPFTVNAGPAAIPSLSAAAALALLAALAALGSLAARS